MRWLHISGLHFGYESLDFDAMRKSLLTRLAPRIGSIDCLFITGDLQYAPSSVTGAQNQAIEYIQKLQETLGVSPEDTFLVPGNHDVNRTAAHAALVQQQLERYDGQISPDFLHATQSAQASFLKVRQVVCKQNMSSTGHYCQQRHGYNIICLNTSLFSFRDGEDGTLILGLALLDKLFGNVEPGLPVIVLAHHDLMALCSKDRDFFRHRLTDCLLKTRPGKSDSVMYLCGHSHDLRPQSERLGDYTLYTFTSGVQWNYDAPRRSDYTVMTGEISDDNDSGHVQAYRWVSKISDFIPDSAFSYDGKQDYALDGRWYFPSRPMSEQPLFATNRDTVDTLVSSWLHLSDLHVFQEADKNLILEDYDALRKICDPSFLIVTGDFRHIVKDRDYQKANAFLEEIMNKFGLSKAQVFLAPGNHDVNRSPSKDRETAIQDITSKMAENKRHYSAYSEHMECLLNNFSDFDIFVKDFYRNSGIKTDDERVTRPSGVYHVLWNDKLHIFCMNTALISDGARTHKEIADINALTERVQEIKKNNMKDNRPIILIGHHGLDDLYPEHEKRIRGIIERYQISAYLHGDIHQYATDPILPLHLSSRVIPSIACGKSAPESGDSESDIGAVYYEWHVQKNISRTSGQVQGLPRSFVTVKAFRWDITGFHLDTRYMHDIVKDYTFDMLGDIPV